MEKNYLLNAIIGDVAGSIYEWNRIKVKPDTLIGMKCHITDDTAMTIAIAEALMTDMDFSSHMRKWGNLYPHLGYSEMFCKWLDDLDMGPYNSFGNGSVMRVSACGWMKNHPVTLAKKSAEVTHNHPEGIKGARFVTKCILYARKFKGEGVDEIKSQIGGSLLINYPGYEISKSLDERRANYGFDETCQGSVPQSVQCVLEANSYEDALKLAISMGGDSDTMACIAGSIAGVIWEKPNYLVDWVKKLMPKDMLKVVDDFDKFVDENSSI